MRKARTLSLLVALVGPHGCGDGADPTAPECQNSTECSGETPLCVDGVCAGCGVPGTSEACVELNVGEPVCAPSGECVECTDHDQCNSQVCDRDANACVAEESIVYVANGGFLGDEEIGADSPGCGVPQRKCLSIKYAVDNRLDNDLGRVWVKVADGQYRDQIVLENQTARIIGGNEVRQGLSGAPNDELIVMFDVAEGVDLLIDRMIVTSLGAMSKVILCYAEQRIPSKIRVHRSTIGNASLGGLELVRYCEGEVLESTIQFSGRTGIRSVFEGNSLVVRDSAINSNEGAGIDFQEGPIEVTRTEFTGNDGGGMSLTSADFLVRNNFFVHNGHIDSLVGGFRIRGDGPNQRVFEFNTVVNNIVAVGDAPPGVFCDTIAPIEIKNNLIWGNRKGTTMGHQQIGGFCEVSYNNVQSPLVGDDKLTIGEGNVDTDPLFADEFRNDYRITSESPAKDAADPAAILDIDFDGNPRPFGEGHDMGAHEVQE